MQILKKLYQFVRIVIQQQFTGLLALKKFEAAVKDGFFQKVLLTLPRAVHTI